MAFHLSLSNKSPQVFRTLLSIRTVLHDVVVWMISTCPPTSKYSCPFGDCTKSTNHNWYNSHFHSFFNSLAKLRYLSFFSHFFSFILWSAGQQSPKFRKFYFLIFLFLFIHLFIYFIYLFFVEYYKVWSSGGDWGIHLYVKVRLEFMRVIF